MNGVLTVKSLLKETAFTLSVLTVMTFGYSSPVPAQSSSTQAPLLAVSVPPGDSGTIKSPESGASAARARVRIGAGDLLNVSIFDVPEMTQTIRVNDLGDATLSLVGSLHLADLTTAEAQAFIAKKLKAGNFLVNPGVSVLISEYSTQGVSVLGEVTKPGVYQVLGSRTLLDIISEAGGITSFAGSEATVKHVDGSTATVRLTKDAQASLSTDVQLAPGDKVIIPRAGLVYVLGDVGRPGGFIMGNDGKMTLLQAVAMAGGINRTSSMNRSRFIRKGPSGYTETPVAVKKILEGKRADIQLQTEDIVYIPSNSAKSFIYRTGPSIASSVAGAAIYRGFP
jgi:polysaccharide export outer membrane protein